MVSNPMSDTENEVRKTDLDESQLTDRELKIAQVAARIAVREMTDEFYKNVGKNVVQRFLVLVGALVVGFLAGKGFIKLD